MFIFPMATFLAGFSTLGRRNVATFSSLQLAFPRSDFDSEEFWLELKIFWETCRKVVKLVAFTRGLVWGVMARSLGTPDERMCEYFGPFCLFYIDIFASLGFKLAITE